MSLPHIPVRVIAADPAETQAFADVLSGGQSGALALAGAGENPLVALVCPSGDAAQAGELPAVALGPGGVAIPAALSDIFSALEQAADAAAGLSGARHYGAWMLDPARLVLRLADERTIGLTDTEARLLACLMDASGAEVTRDVLLQRVWGYRPGLDTHTLETHIYRLRKKIEADPGSPSFVLTTESGYRLR
jgi:hypothetical protein